MVVFYYPSFIKAMTSTSGYPTPGGTIYFDLRCCLAEAQPSPLSSVALVLGLARALARTAARRARGLSGPGGLDGRARGDEEGRVALRRGPHHVVYLQSARSGVLRYQFCKRHLEQQHCLLYHIC